MVTHTCPGPEEEEEEFPKVQSLFVFNPSKDQS